MKRVDAEDFGRAAASVMGPLFGDAGPFAFSDVTPDAVLEAVANIIWRHQGRQRPVTIAALMGATGVLTERHMKGIVEALVMQHAMLIGGSRDRDGGGGYFIICDEEDFKASVGPYQAQIETMQTRLDRLKRMAIDRGVLRV